MDNKIEPAVEVGASDLVVRVEIGTEFEASPRLRTALEELSAAMAAEETDQVVGYEFGNTMALGFSPAMSDEEFFHVHVGCVRITTGGPCTCKGAGSTYVITTAPASPAG